MNLELLRKIKGFTLEDVQKITGIHYSVLSLLEHGKRRPTRDHQIRLYRLLGNDLELDNTTFAGVPEMPAPVWKNGKPDYSDLDTHADQENEEEEDFDDSGDPWK